MSEYKQQRKAKKMVESYSIHSLHLYLWVLQLPGNRHNSSVRPGKLKLNKTLFIPLSHSPILPCHEQSIPNRWHNGSSNMLSILLIGLNTLHWIKSGFFPIQCLIKKSQKQNSQLKPMWNFEHIMWWVHVVLTDGGSTLSTDIILCSCI